MLDIQLIPLAAVQCSQCGERVGEAVWHIEKREVWLRLGTVVVHHASGVCGRCGTRWFWSASRRPERVLRRAADRGILETK